MDENDRLELERQIRRENYLQNLWRRKQLANLFLEKALIAQTTTKGPNIRGGACQDYNEGDCSIKRGLCHNRHYLMVMRRNCPRSCGFCGQKLIKPITNDGGFSTIINGYPLTV